MPLQLHKASGDRRVLFVKSWASTKTFVSWRHRIDVSSCISSSSSSSSQSGTSCVTAGGVLISRESAIGQWCSDGHFSASELNSVVTNVTVDSQSQQNAQSIVSNEHYEWTHCSGLILSLIICVMLSDVKLQYLTFLITPICDTCRRHHHHTLF